MRVKANQKSASDRVGVQSVEIGLSVLRVIADATGPLTLASLSDATGMPRSQLHKYLASLIRAGFVAQVGPGQPYGLGAYALELGLTAMRKLEITQIAQEKLDELRDQLSTTASLAVWGNRGPTIVRWAETPHMVTQSVRLGTVFPILTSTLGLVFAAHLDRRFTEQTINAELDDKDGPAARQGIRNWADVERRLNAVRKNGFAAGDSIVALGVMSIAAPVLNHAGSIVAVIAVAEQVGHLDTSRAGKPVTAILGAAAALSKRLGADVPDAQRSK